MLSMSIKYNIEQFETEKKDIERKFTKFYHKKLKKYRSKKAKNSDIYGTFEHQIVSGTIWPKNLEWFKIRKALI